MQRLYESQAYSSHVGSYWETTAPPQTWPILNGNKRAKVVIIGGGYTGLNCALKLASSGLDPASIVILEAQQPGWGASGRNGGFCCLGGSKLTTDQAIKRFGETETYDYVQAQKTSIETVSNNLNQYNIEADPHSHGETQLAYKPEQVAALEAEKLQLKSLFDVDCHLTSKSQMSAEGFQSRDFHAALTNPIGFALNPMKYVLGLSKAVSDIGVQTFGNSPAIKMKYANGEHLVTTPYGSISAKHLVIATNGYSSEDLPNWLSGRLMPVLTNIIATRPLTPQELTDQGWTSHQMCYDTRHSLHYFRLMPGIKGEGPRMLFGMRGGTSASDESNKIRLRKIRSDFERIFPAWQNVETPYFWSGLVCLTQNLTSYTGPIPEMKNAWASLAYHGNGVAMASHCGTLLADMIAETINPKTIPAQMRQPPKHFPFPSLRRTYLQAAFKWYEWLDK